MLMLLQHGRRHCIGLFFIMASSKIEKIQYHLALLSIFFASSDDVDYSEFQRFIPRQLQDSEEVAAFEWAPMIT